MRPGPAGGGVKGSTELTIDFAGRIGERYDLGELLGHGGMADVYRATDSVLGRDVAVKVLRSSAGPADRDRFLDEGRILANLGHPGLVTLLDVGVDDEHPFLVMELVDGSTLADLAGVPMDPDDVARIGTELANALAFAHDSGVVHRDVKPGNVLLREDGRVALFDFGIARLAGDLRHHTAPGLSVGTAAYVAPEQVEGSAVGPAADVYSLGLVLLELLSGVREYSGPPLEAAVARLHRSPEVPSSLPVVWQRLLRQMTAIDPAIRPSAAEAAAALRDLKADGSTEPTYVDLPRVVQRRDFPWPRILVALGAVALLVLVASGWVLVQRTPDAAEAEDGQQIPKVASSLQVLLEDLHAALAPLAADRPALAANLDRIDRALMDRRYPAARVQLKDLTGRLRSLTGADAALSSANALLAALPRAPAPTPVSSAGPEPSSSDSSSGDRHPGKGKGGKPGHGKGKKG